MSSVAAADAAASTLWGDIAAGAESALTFTLNGGEDLLLTPSEEAAAKAKAEAEAAAAARRARFAAEVKKAADDCEGWKLPPRGPARRAAARRAAAAPPVVPKPAAAPAPATAEDAGAAVAKDEGKFTKVLPKRRQKRRPVTLFSTLKCWLVFEPERDGSMEIIFIYKGSGRPRTTYTCYLDEEQTEVVAVKVGSLVVKVGPCWVDHGMATFCYKHWGHAVDSSCIHCKRQSPKLTPAIVDAARLCRKLAQPQLDGEKPFAERR